MKGLKQQLEALQKVVRERDNANAGTMKGFTGCGIVYVTVSKEIGKVLKLEKNHKGEHIIGRVSSNGSVGQAEDEVREIISKDGIEAHQYTYLT